VRGDAVIDAGEIRLGPGAVVRGDLRWSSESPPVLARGARIEGLSIPEPRSRPSPAVPAVVGAVFWLASFALAALVVALVLPLWTASLAAATRTRPWLTLALGAAAMVVTPIVIALSFATGLLWLVGVLLLAVYVLALLAGGLLGTVAFADLVVDGVTRGPVTRGKRLAAVTSVALVVAALSLVPVLGWIVLLLLTVVGIGSASSSAWSTRRARRASYVALEPAPRPAPSPG
jgi:hypothetical protein